MRTTTLVLGGLGAATATSLAATAAISSATMTTSGAATLNSLGVTNACTVGTTLGVTGLATLASAKIATLSGLAYDAIVSSIGAKQASISNTTSGVSGFQGIWDSATTTVKGLVCTAPLVLTSATAYLTVALSTTAAYTMGALTCTGTATVGSLTASSTGTVKLNGGASVYGTLNVQSIMRAPGMYWAAGRIKSDDTIIDNNGYSTFTVVRSTGFAAGVWHIAWTNVHPTFGGDYGVIVTEYNVQANVRQGVMPTAYSLEISLYTLGTSTLHDGDFYFAVMGW